MIRRGRLALAVALLVAGCGTSSVEGDQTGFVSSDGSAVLRDAADRGTPLTIDAQLVQGGGWSLADLRGRVVLLNTWGPWCAPCRAELPLLQRLADEYEAEGLSVVGFATRTNAAAVTAYLTKASISFPQVADYDSAVMASVGGVPSATIPSTLLIDHQGRVAGWVLGKADESLIKSLVQELLEE